jgi:4,5-DOPA dioxygenase extradiol
MTLKMPVLFVGHGAPTNAIEDNAFTREWARLAGRIPRPKAIVCVSAHWQTQGVQVTSGAAPETIHDFRGFPKALEEFRYPARGHPQLAAQIGKLLPVARLQQDPTRGLDHGAWSVLTKMYPKADVPVVQLSLAFDQKPSFHYSLGRQLAPLRDAGVLLLGSGNIVHNLQLMTRVKDAPPRWATHINEIVKSKIEARDHLALIEFESLDLDMRLAIPSDEHYLPLLYVLGAQDPSEPIEFFNDDIVLGAIAMTGVAIGMPPAA